MNLTDEQIIKALECCLDCNCKECPCCRIIDGGTHCTEIDEEEILDLINRQKAVNELAAKKIVDLKLKVKEQKAEIERLKSCNKICVEAMGDQEIELAKTKAEAIKEFAERLKEKGNMSKDGLIVVDYQIDNLAKEMVGE